MEEYEKFEDQILPKEVYTHGFTGGIPKDLPNLQTMEANFYQDYQDSGKGGGKFCRDFVEARLDADYAFYHVSWPKKDFSPGHKYVRQRWNMADEKQKALVQSKFQKKLENWAHRKKKEGKTSPSSVITQAAALGMSSPKQFNQGGGAHSLHSTTPWAAAAGPGHGSNSSGVPVHGDGGNPQFSTGVREEVATMTKTSAPSGPPVGGGWCYHPVLGHLYIPWNMWPVVPPASMIGAGPPGGSTVYNNLTMGGLPHMASMNNSTLGGPNLTFLGCGAPYALPGYMMSTLSSPSVHEHQEPMTEHARKKRRVSGYLNSIPDDDEQSMNRIYNFVAKEEAVKAGKAAAPENGES